MGDRYYINLSRQDAGLGSYFPTLELKDNPDADWLETFLIPAIEPIAKRKAKFIHDMPITFWVTVRETARYPAEAFLFTTPPYPGVKIERVLRQVWQTLQGGNIHQGREYFSDILNPSKAIFPYCQIFRGKFIRFYTELENYTDYYVPTVRWTGRAPELIFYDIPEEAAIIDLEDESTPWLWVRAKIVTYLNGEYFRKFQQALSTIARKEDGE